MPDRETLAVIISVISLAIGAVVAPIITHYLTLTRMRHELRQGKELVLHEARSQYEVDAQRRLAEAVGASKSQIVDAGYELHRRFENLFQQIGRQWGGERTWLASTAGAYEYYFISSIHRILRLLAWAEILNRSLTYIDRSIPGADEERTFLNHVRFTRNSLAETRLFEDLPYDPFYETAHLFADNLLAMAEQLIQSGKRSDRDAVMGSAEFSAKFKGDSEFRDNFQSLMDFLEDFEGPETEPLKWARLVAMHYAVARLLSRFGYDFQRVASPNSILERLDLPKDARGYSAHIVRRNLLRLAGECSLSAGD